MKLQPADIQTRIAICAERSGGRKNLAEACDISLPQLFRYSKGQAVLPSDRLLRIASAANVHPYWLLTGAGSPDIPPIHSFLSPDQKLSIDPVSLTQCIALADTIDRDHNLQMTPQRKSEYIFALYQGTVFEGHLTEKHKVFEPSKALEIYAYLDSISSEIPRKLILNTVEIMRQVTDHNLPDKEIMAFCNYLNSTVKCSYDHPKIKSYYDRIGYFLEGDTVAHTDKLMDNFKKKYSYRNEPIKLLDLGCGNARYLLSFVKDAKLDARGLDDTAFSKKICQAYEASGKLPKGTFVEGDMFNLPFADQSFDFIFSHASIFQTPFFIDSPHGLNQVISECKRILRPKGAIYIFSRYGQGFEPFPFFQLHNEGSIRQLAQKHGFRIENFQTFFLKGSIDYLPKVNFSDWFSVLLTLD